MIWVLLSLCLGLLFFSTGILLNILERTKKHELDILCFKSILKESDGDRAYQLTDWGKEIKVCILSLQADVLRNRTPPPVKKELAKPVRAKKKVTRSAETKKIISDKAKARWADKRREKENSPSLFTLNSN